MNSKPSTPESKPAEFIRDNFDPGDRLAMVLLRKRTGEVIQRIAAAVKIAADDFQAWLRAQNDRGYEIYLSMNVLREAARGRTKADIEIIRHIYLDFDDHGTSAIEKLTARPDLPAPNYLVNTSPDKWQVIWKAQGFRKDQAEELQRALANQLGADPAATDCSRVLRLPGFTNHKYSKPFVVVCQRHSAATYGPEHFPNLPAEARVAQNRANGSVGARRTGFSAGTISQSERDWAYAKRALARGDPEEVVIAAVASHRRYDKHNPQYYAEHTVRKAAQAIQLERSQRQTDSLPER